MTDEHDQLCSWVAAYTLGALDATDRRIFEVHLESCHRCAAELATLAPLPALIGRIDPRELDIDVDRARAEAVAAGAVQEFGLARRRKRRRSVMLVVAAAAIVVALTVGNPRSTPESSGELAAVSSSLAAEAAITLTPRLWGTEIALSIDGLPQRDRYQLWSVDGAGAWTAAATWSPTPTGAVRLTGACSTAFADLERVVVTSDDQEDLLVEARPS